MANEKYLEEAFKALDILEEDVFNVSGNDIEEVKSFIDSGEDLENTVEVIDPLATDEEEVQDSYIGKAILDCVICQSKIYKDPEEVVLSTSVDEEKLANIGEECPYCQSIDGYRVIGQVAEYCPNCENTEDIATNDTEDTATNDIEDKKFDEKLIKENLHKKLKKSASAIKESYDDEYYDEDDEDIIDWYEDEDKHPLIDAYYTACDELGVWPEPSIQGRAGVIVCFENGTTIPKYKVDYTDEIDFMDNLAYSFDDPHNLSKEDIKQAVAKIKEFISSYKVEHDDTDDFDESLKSKHRKKLKPVKEDLEKVSVETDSTVLTMEQAENGKVVVTTEPTEKAEEPTEEMIAEITPEVEAKFKDIEIDEFEEKDFDELGEKYLKRVYENVQAYKTVKGSTKGNRLTLEGLIEFKSGKKAKTHFVFEAKLITKTGKLKFIGENKQFAKGKRAFTLTGRANGTKLIAESLTYNYKAKDAKTGASKKLYGTVSKVRK